MRYIVWAFVVLVGTTSWADQSPGFHSGQQGLGFFAGLPFSVRYQYWLNWRSAVFADVGYHTDQFIMGDANYSYYFLNEEDRWKISDRKVGHILYNVFGGVTAGAYTGKKDEKARLGIRAGAAFEYLLPDSSWSLRAEVAPVFYLSGNTTAGVQAGVGAMYYFDDFSKMFGSKKKARKRR